MREEKARGILNVAPDPIFGLMRDEDKARASAIVYLEAIKKAEGLVEALRKGIQYTYHNESMSPRDCPHCVMCRALAQYERER